MRREQVLWEQQEVEGFQGEEQFKAVQETMERSDMIQQWNEEVRNKCVTLLHFQDHINTRNWALFFVQLDIFTPK